MSSPVTLEEHSSSRAHMFTLNFTLFRHDSHTKIIRSVTLHFKSLEFACKKFGMVLNSQNIRNAK